MLNWQATVYSQYANSGVLTGIIQALNDAIDPASMNTAFYNLMWNVATAAGYGLDVWGRIVGVSRILQVPGGRFFGFNEAAVSYDPFNQASFYAGTAGSTSYALSDSAMRLLVLAKALANISDASIHTYNAILQLLFPGRGHAYVTDTGNMVEVITFEFALLPYEVSIIKSSGAIQAPTGVGFNVMVVPISPGATGTFGFKEAGYSASPFNNGTFFKGFA